IYFVIYLAGALSWTVHGERYLLPVLPVLIWLLISGVPRFRPYVLTTVVALGVAGCIWTIYLVRSGSHSPEEVGFMQAVQWLGSNAPKTELVMSRYPTWVGTVTGNRGIRWEEVDDPAAHHRELIDTNITWVIVDHNKVFRDAGS